MKKNIVSLSVVCISLLGGACAHKIENNLSEKIAAQESPRNSEDLAAETSLWIQKAPGLTDEQRSKLLTLKERTQAQIRAAEELSLKLRTALYRDLAAEKFNRTEVNLLKNKIKKVERKKVSTLLDAVEEANTILGRGTTNSERMLDDLYFNLNRDPKYRLQQ